ncbi:MAG: hypothetical protein U9Q38_05780, partial [Thermodesulfobacteriota bacterium]|nr:hypothetical protein [Thermodesulfobacteriota bacterium]
ITAKSASEENEGLRSALDASKKQVAALRDEKDVLMVRLVLAESRLEEGASGMHEKQTEEPGDKSSPVVSSVETGPGPDDIEKTVSSDNGKQPAEKPTDSEPEKLLSVAIEDFNVSFEPYSSELKVQFKIINTSGDSQPVSGHAFVILQDNGIDQDRWLTFPRAMLVSRKPSQYNKGQYFSIYRFKTVKFNAQNETEPLRFKNAIVLVYSIKGDLLLEKEYPIQIQGMESSLTE